MQAPSVSTKELEQSLLLTLIVPKLVEFENIVQRCGHPTQDDFLFILS